MGSISIVAHWEEQAEENDKRHRSVLSCNFFIVVLHDMIQGMKWCTHRHRQTAVHSHTHILLGLYVHTNNYTLYMPVTTWSLLNNLVP